MAKKLFLLFITFITTTIFTATNTLPSQQVNVIDSSQAITLSQGDTYSFDVMLPSKKTGETVTLPKVEPDFRKYARCSCKHNKENIYHCTVFIAKKAPSVHFQITQKHIPRNTKKSSYIVPVLHVNVLPTKTVARGKSIKLPFSYNPSTNPEGQACGYKLNFDDYNLNLLTKECTPSLTLESNSQETNNGNPIGGSTVIKHYTLSVPQCAPKGTFYVVESTDLESIFSPKIKSDLQSVNTNTTKTVKKRTKKNNTPPKNTVFIITVK